MTKYPLPAMTEENPIIWIHQDKKMYNKHSSTDNKNEGNNTQSKKIIN